MNTTLRRSAHIAAKKAAAESKLISERIESLRKNIKMTTQSYKAVDTLKHMIHLMQHKYKDESVIRKVKYATSLFEFMLHADLFTVYANYPQVRCAIKNKIEEFRSSIDEYRVPERMVARLRLALENVASLIQNIENYLEILGDSK
jgi:hypothetical protein